MYVCNYEINKMKFISFKTKICIIRRFVEIITIYRLKLFLVWFYMHIKLLRKI